MIRQLFLLAFVFLALPASGQRMSSELWEEQAKTNIRLLPKYGHRVKNAEQLAIDQKFITETMQQPQYGGDRRMASVEMVEAGFGYLGRRDLKTAMYRFNQAYLLDSTNPDIYNGFGAVYMALGNYENAQKQYKEGLLLDKDNTHLLTDYGTYYMAQYYGLQSLDAKAAQENLDSAITHLTRSYGIDPKDPNTTFKLSVCYLQKGRCDLARMYYDKCKAVGGQPITEEYTAELAERCGG